jgi:predicted flavoprotein YhiN
LGAILLPTKVHQVACVCISVAAGKTWQQMVSKQQQQQQPTIVRVSSVALQGASDYSCQSRSLVLQLAGTSCMPTASSTAAGYKLAQQLLIVIVCALQAHCK